MKTLLVLLAALSLGVSTCDETNPTPPVSDYCHGNDYSVMNNVAFGYEADGVTGGLAAILHGNPSDTIRGTVQVTFGGSYCSGVALGDKLVLTAGHCGYAPTTAHTVKVYKRDATTGRVAVDRSIQVARHIVHPDYLEYTRSGGSENRKADLMLLHLSEPLPDTVQRVTFYDEAWASFCNGGVAQGFGQWEGSYFDLRETKYIVTQASEKLLTSRATQLPPGQESGRICFGDSGGPLYMDVGGVAYLAGITSTTMSADCEAGGNHVRAAAFMDWIVANGVP